MVCTVVCFILALHAAVARRGETDEQRLLYHLLRNYEKAVRPVRNASDTVTVKLGMTLTSIFDMDERNQVMTLNVWLDQEWNDELLRWDPAEFGGITNIRIPCDNLWLPDIVLYNNADDYTTGYMRSRAMVDHTGTVFWPPPIQLRSTCSIDVTYFPFDSQFCSLKFGSWTYNGFQVDVTNRSESIDLSNYVESGEFSLVSVHQLRRVVKYTCCPEPYPDLTFFIHIRRKILYYVYNIVFPCALLSTLTLLVFCLPPDSGEKIALGITVLLAFSVFVLSIASGMPETSDSVPLIGLYLTAVMALTSVSVVMTVIVLNFHHRGPYNKPVPPFIRYLILEKLRSWLGMKIPYSDSVRSSISANGLMRKMSVRLAMEDMTEDVFKDLGQQFQTAVEENGDRVKVRALKQQKSLDLSHSVLLRNNNERRSKKSGDLHVRLLKTLQLLIRRQEQEDESQNRANEWRQVAQVIDRLLFWLFFSCTTIVTLTLLVAIPAWHRAHETTEFHASHYKLHKSD